MTAKQPGWVYTHNTPEMMREDPNDPRHGTYNGYSNLKCRCDPGWSPHGSCKRANAAETVKARNRRKAGPIPEHVHGTESGYTNYGCDCQRCMAKWSQVTNRRRKNRQAKLKEEAAAAT